MTKIDNALGKKIQITNSLIYSQLKEKEDFYFDLDYETMLLSLGNLSFTLGKYIGADVEKIKLYTSIYGLGCVDGGKVTLDYINKQILEDKNKISELDVMLYNLKKIFPDLEKKFSDQDIFEISQLFSNKCTIIETQVIKIIYWLKLISQGYKKMGKFDDSVATEFIFSEIQKIIENYSQTKSLNFSPNLQVVANNFLNQKYELLPIDKNKLDEIVRYCDNKYKIIEQLNNFKKEKKTKVR